MGPVCAKSRQMPLTFAKFDTYLDTKRPPLNRHIRPQRGNNQGASVVKSHESHYANLRSCRENLHFFNGTFKKAASRSY